MTKIVDLRAKSPDELTDQLMALKKEQFNLRFQKAQGQVESTSRVRLIRRDIARIKTLQGGKSVAAKPVAVRAAAPETSKKKTVSAGKKK